ncbi:response regulator transcription factor [uncultured Desulfosarcina sp.]|uniref:response regulator transcription factor n=1 Tax=uncultured Desulfosarcina sp. TaxID=218289 RepID=UPI0029C9A51F|nr:response regulator transcription factor [uncultured Desulfosarcina sp.]
MATGSTILMISCDLALVEQIETHMEANGFKTVTLDSGEDPQSWIGENSPATVIVDATMPGMNGFFVCREIRKKYDGPILFLNGESDDLDELLAFETGADDYIARPLHPRIMAARINALLKRNRAAGQPSTDPVAIGDLIVDPARREAYLKDSPLRLTTTQFDLLWHLANHTGTVVSRDDLNRVLYKTDYNGIDRSIDVYISRIRRKLGDDPTEPIYLKTVRGVGYIFTAPN